MPKIVLLGATGYTGRLAAAALVRRGADPVLAGRNQTRVQKLAADLGGAQHEVVEATFDGVRAVLDPGDVLATTVGPFTELGEPVLAAAIEAGAHYLDCAGESGFQGDVFERYGPQAESKGVAVFTGFGADWVPGNLAGAMALAEAGGGATALDIRYIVTGDHVSSLGSAATGNLLRQDPPPRFAWRDGGLVRDPEMTTITFEHEGEDRTGFAVSTTEHYALPRLAPALQRIDVYLSLSSSATPSIGDGPTDDERAASGQHLVATATGPGGETLAEVRLTGGNGYDYTGEILAWGAGAVLAGQHRGAGALGPVDGFGLDALLAGSRSAGLGPAES